MKEVKLAANLKGRHYFLEMRPWLHEQSIEHTYFSGKNEIVFTNNEDALVFLLRYGGSSGSVVTDMNNHGVNNDS